MKKKKKEEEATEKPWGIRLSPGLHLPTVSLIPA